VQGGGQGEESGGVHVTDSAIPFDLETATPQELKARLFALSEAFRKLKDDNDAFRQRMSRNLERRLEQRHERLLTTFIDILDNFDRALDAAEKTFTDAPLVEGLILVRSQLLGALQEEGLERVPVIGRPFDPEISEVVETEAVSDHEHHHLVMKELMRGYRLNGKLARPSRVVVGEYAPDAAAEATLRAHVSEPLIGADEDGLGDILGEVEVEGLTPFGAARATEDGPSLDDILAGVEEEKKAEVSPQSSGTLDLDELEREMREIFGSDA
jgi:molecular chaperone GrpE